MIHKKIIEVNAIKTKEGLEYDISNLPQGVNVMSVRYIPNEKKARRALLVIWCSDNPLVEFPLDASALNEVTGGNLKIHGSHKDVPKKLGLGFKKWQNGMEITLDSDD